MKLMKQDVRVKVLLRPFVFQLLFIMFSIEFVKGALLVSILPVYLASVLGASSFAVGMTLSAQYIGDNLLRSPTGFIMDRFGYRPVMITGIGLTFTAIVVMSIGHAHGWFVLGAALLGFGSSPLWPCVVSGTTGTAGDQARGTIMGFVHFSWLCGAGLGPIIINFFVKDNHYTLAFRVVLVLTAAVTIVSLFLPKNRGKSDSSETPTAQAGRIQPDGQNSRSPFHLQRYMIEFFRSIRVSPFLFPSMFVQNMAIGIVAPVIALYAKTVLGLSSNEFSLFLLVGGSLTVLLIIPVGRWVDKLGINPFLPAGFALASVNMVLFPYVHSLAWLYPMVGLIGVSFALIIPSWNTLIASAVPKEKRGAAWGFFLTIEGFGMVVGPLAGGMLWDRLGPKYPFLVSGSLLTVLFILQWFIQAQQRENKTFSMSR